MNRLYRAYILCRLCRVFHAQRVKRPSFLFPILIIPVLDMESPQRDPRPPHPTHHQPGRSWLYTLRARLPSTDIAHGHSPDIPIIALNASSYPILASPIHAGPDIMHGCSSRNALSDRITPYMPDYDQQSEKQKDSKMPHLLYTKLPYFAMFVRKFYFGPYFTH